MPDDRELVIPSKGPICGGLIQIGPRLPEVANDGRWHRWNGRRLATCHPDGGVAIKTVGRWAWLFRYGGEIPRLGRPLEMPRGIEDQRAATRRLGRRVDA